MDHRIRSILEVSNNIQELIMEHTPIPAWEVSRLSKFPLRNLTWKNVYIPNYGILRIIEVLKQ